MQIREQVVDEERRPDKGFQEAQNARFERSGVLDKIHCRANQTQAVYRPAGGITAHLFSLWSAIFVWHRDKLLRNK